MSLTAANSLPLQVERTDKKREPIMPLSKYFKGKGEQVMSDMQDRYGADKGKSVFYATANKNDQNPPDKSKPAKRKSIGQRMVERSGY
jgi:hypothetical protein